MDRLLGIVLSVVPITALLTALIHDASNSRIGWLILELVIFPIGVLRGIGIWLGFV